MARLYPLVLFWRAVWATFLSLPWKSLDDSKSSAAQSVSGSEPQLSESLSEGAFKSLPAPDKVCIGVVGGGGVAGEDMAVDRCADVGVGQPELKGRGVPVALTGVVAALRLAASGVALPGLPNLGHTVAFITMAFCTGGRIAPLDTLRRFSNSLRPGSLCARSLVWFEDRK